MINKTSVKNKHSLKEKESRRQGSKETRRWLEKDLFVTCNLLHVIKCGYRELG